MEVIEYSSRTIRMRAPVDEIKVTVATSPRGVVWLSLDDGCNTLSSFPEIAAEFPDAVIIEKINDTQLEVFRFLAGEVTGSRISLDLCGTPFRLKVWEELQKIPAGETITYKELAERIGLPGAARAVGNAVGANRVAVLVPCHRVVPAKGGSGKFRWGADLKRRLLESERSL